MLRLFLACLLAAALAAAAVWLVSPNSIDPPGKPGKAGDGTAGASAGEPAPARELENAAGVAARPGEAPAVLLRPGSPAHGPRALRLHDARVLTAERQEVPSKRNGELLFLATEAVPGTVPPGRTLVTSEVPVLAFRVRDWAGVPEGERLADTRTRGLYRRPRPGEELTTSDLAVIFPRLVLRKLDKGDRVKAGDMLGLVRPDIAVADVRVKVDRINGAEADVRSSKRMADEARARLARIRAANARGGGTVSKEEEGLALATLARYEEETRLKQAKVGESRSELWAALAALNMHYLRASIDGEVRTVYRYPGEAAKENEPVLQLESPNLLFVEAQVEIKDALTLWARMEQAQKCRDQARAAQLLRVEVEVPLQKAPVAILAGHGQAVTCVAATHDGEAIVSGSEDQTARLWKRHGAGWAEQAQLDHQDGVRCLAVTGADSPRRLVLTGTAGGWARVFDLKDLEAGPLVLKARHTGAINALALSPDGSRCVTAGEDAALCLCDTKTGGLLRRLPSAHRAAITSAAFASNTHVVTAGRDQRLAVWKLGEGGLSPVSSLGPRGGEVATLGVSPDGKHALLDDGREMRVMTLDGRNIVGTLRKPAGSSNFAGFALFSPDGKTILTGGNGPGGLQLWRNPAGGAPPSELRQYLWGGTATCAAFLPGLAVTGTSDRHVLVWELPTGKEARTRLQGTLTYAEKFLDTSLRRVTVRASFEKPDWVAPGATATVVVPPVAK